jgi:transposase
VVANGRLLADRFLDLGGEFAGGEELVVLGEELADGGVGPVDFGMQAGEVGAGVALVPFEAVEAVLQLVISPSGLAISARWAWVVVMVESGTPSRRRSTAMAPWTLRRVVAARVNPPSELDPVARTPDLRWPCPAGKDVYVPAPHPAEFRRRAVELARLGEQPIAAVAKQLQISESCLRNGVAQADADGNGGAAPLPTAERKELSQLRRDKRRLEMETRSSSGRQRTSPARTCSQTSVSTGPRTRRRQRRH